MAPLTCLIGDTPFYMSNRAHYVPTSFMAPESDRMFGGRGQSRIDSENEDLRGVIDDLTVENRKLKQILRTQRSQNRAIPSDVSQPQDKLFDVRVHGLQPDKRRELEHLLKNFATSVYSSTGSKPTLRSQASSAASSGHHPAGKAPQTDSGYGSISASGQGSGLGSMSSAKPSSSTKAVKSYLKDIPDSLLPRHSPLTSERAKQALIVKRLEQLFTGRTAAPGAHAQPLQQQEISQIAAHADRAEDVRNNRKRKAEGTREAHVMPPDTKVSFDTADCDQTSVPVKLQRAESASTSGAASPDQRPTRPLDLDIDRAQVAAENMSYIKHLGLLHQPSDATPLEDDQSPWIYMNLLTGLAQLHTLNVTPGQVRKAIARFSKKMEMHKDGHRVRWVGGAEGTKFAAEDEKAIEAAENSTHESIEDATMQGGSSKRSQSNSTSNAMTSITPSEDKTSGLQTSSDSKDQLFTTFGTSKQLPTTASTKPTTVSSAFDYKPILYRPKTPANYDDVYGDFDDSLESSSGDSSGLVQALSKSNLNRKSKDEGLMTFYDNPYFCSDFSSEKQPSNMTSSRLAIVGECVGLPIPTDLCESPLRFHDATYFTSQFAPKPFDPTRLSFEDQDQFEKSLPRLPRLEPISEAGEEETMPMDFEVCGLGGITPEDNFALDVKVAMQSTPSRGPDTITTTLPFSRRRYVQKYAHHVASCNKLDLLPSKLPPPSYLFFTTSSGSDVSESDNEECPDDDSDDTSSPAEDYPTTPALFPQVSGDSGSNFGDDEAGDRDSSDIDMLAYARKFDPQQIAEQERVYMINEPGIGPRVATGSLAATIGASGTSPSMDGDASDNASVDSAHGSLDEEESDREMNDE